MFCPNFHQQMSHSSHSQYQYHTHHHSHRRQILYLVYKYIAKLFWKYIINITFIAVVKLTKVKIYKRPDLINSVFFILDNLNFLFFRFKWSIWSMNEIKLLVSNLEIILCRDSLKVWRSCEYNCFVRRNSSSIFPDKIEIRIFFIK